MAKFWISTNQITQAELNILGSKLACDGVHFIAENSPDVTNWSPVHNINPNNLRTEEGAIDRHWLLNPAWPVPAPRINYNLKIATDAGFTVDASLAYVENPTTMLTPTDVEIAYGYLQQSMFLLARSFNGEVKEQVRAAIKLPHVRGIFFELNPNAENVKNTNALQGLREVLLAGKRCSILLPPWPGTIRYEYDIKSAVTELMRSPYYHNVRFSITLACYDRTKNTVGFLGKHNSIEAALRWLDNNG